MWLRLSAAVLALLMFAGACSEDSDVSALEHGCNFVTTAWNAARLPTPPVAEAVALSHIARLADPLIEPAAEFREAALDMTGDRTVGSLYAAEPTAADLEIDQEAAERMEGALDELIAICEENGIGLNPELGGPLDIDAGQPHGEGSRFLPAEGTQGTR